MTKDEYIKRTVERAIVCFHETVYDGREKVSSNKEIELADALYLLTRFDAEEEEKFPEINEALEVMLSPLVENGQIGVLSHLQYRLDLSKPPGIAIPKVMTSFISNMPNVRNFIFPNIFNQKHAYTRLKIDQDLKEAIKSEKKPITPAHDFYEVWNNVDYIKSHIDLTCPNVIVNIMGESPRLAQLKEIIADSKPKTAVIKKLVF